MPAQDQHSVLTYRLPMWVRMLSSSSIWLMVLIGCGDSETVAPVEPPAPGDTETDTDTGTDTGADTDTEADTGTGTCTSTLTQLAPGAFCSSMCGLIGTDIEGVSFDCNADCLSIVSVCEPQGKKYVLCVALNPSLEEAKTQPCVDAYLDWGRCASSDFCMGTSYGIGAGLTVQNHDVCLGVYAHSSYCTCNESGGVACTCHTNQDVTECTGDAAPMPDSCTTSCCELGSPSLPDD